MALCYFPHYFCKCKFSDVPCVCHAVYFFHILVQGVPQLLGTSHTCCCLTSFHTHPCLEKCMHILSDFELRSESSSDSACSPSFFACCSHTDLQVLWTCTHSIIWRNLIFTLAFAHGLVLAPHLDFKFYKGWCHVFPFFSLTGKVYNRYSVNSYNTHSWAHDESQAGY